MGGDDIMDMIQVGMIGIIAVILAISIKRESPVFAVLISLSAGLFIIMLLLPKLSAAFGLIEQMMNDMGADIKYIEIILKIVGIVYICEFCSQICIDVGESAIAAKIELGARVFIMVISMPVISSLLQLITQILP